MTLQDTQLRTLSEMERKVLCKVAVAKLQALNLGVHIRPPSGELITKLCSIKQKARASFHGETQADAYIRIIVAVTRIKSVLAILFAMISL